LSQSNKLNGVLEPRDSSFGSFYEVNPKTSSSCKT